MMPVYQIPLEYLIYNKSNGRILSMVKSFERQFRELNTEVPEDMTIIENFLWDSKPDRNKTTMVDLGAWGQKKFGIVTKDGIIIDGNRRAMLLSRICKKDKIAPGYFLGIILDDSLDDNMKEIMKLETTYQMGEDEKLDYNPIEKYLKCKDLIEIEFSEGDIAKMMGEKKSIIKNWLDIMNLMDSYLDDLGYSGIYTRLEKREGQFVDFNRFLKKYEDGTGLVNWNYKKSDIADLKVICFDHIRAQYEGKEFRIVAQPSKEESFFCNDIVWRKFRDEHFNLIDPINEKDKTVDEIRKENPEGDLSKLLKGRDEGWKTKTKGLMQGNLNKSQRALDDINETNAPKKLLSRALNTLESINTENEAFYDEDVLKLVKKINSKTWDFQQIIKKHK
jgi:hypothetical protein